jgi:HSP20 family protein
MATARKRPRAKLCSALTLTGRVTPPENAKESNVLREYQTKMDTKLSDGVLRLELPKVEKARPRQITVRTD